MTTLPPAPTVPDPDSYSATAMLNYGSAWKARDAASQQLIAELQAQIPVTAPPTRYGANASSAGEHSLNASLFDPTLAWRYYQQPNEPIAYPAEYALTTGQQFAYSHKRTPKEILTGAWDAAIRATCQQMVDHDGGGYFCPMQHEPEGKIETGVYTLADFLAGQDHVIKILREFPKIRVTPILMDYTIRGGKGRDPHTYLPADFDVLGTDAYVAGTIGIPASQAATLFDPTVALAKSLGKAWGAFEVGVGHVVTGQARLDALKAVSSAAHTNGAEVCCYFMRSATDEWALTTAEAAVWKAGQAA